MSAPCHKRAYRSRAKAFRALLEMRHRGRFIERNIYACRKCGAWHLTKWDKP